MRYAAYRLTINYMTPKPSTQTPILFPQEITIFRVKPRVGKKGQTNSGRIRADLPNLTSNYYYDFLDPPNLQIRWPKLGNPGADRILAAPGFANLEGPNWEILRILANFWSS